jgi:hypothetical protein
MANRPRERGQQGQRSGSAGTPSFTEPEVRRWPHPVDGVSSADLRPAASAGQTDISLYYIHCALSYQNQLLSEIKSLLEQLAFNCPQASEENSG